MFIDKTSQRILYMQPEYEPSQTGLTGY